MKMRKRILALMIAVFLFAGIGASVLLDADAASVNYGWTNGMWANGNPSFTYRDYSTNPPSTPTWGNNVIRMHFVHTFGSTFTSSDTAETKLWENKDGYLSNWWPAFCIQPSKGSDLGATATATSVDTATIWNNMPSDVQGTIRQILAYGYSVDYYDDITPANKTDYILTVSARFAATESLIWEVLAGFRSTDGSFTITDAGTAALYNKVYNGYTVQGQGQKIIYQTNYNAIVSKIQAANKYPSFTSKTESGASTYTMTYNTDSNNYSVTLTDSNSVLTSSAYTIKIFNGSTDITSKCTTSISSYKATIKIPADYYSALSSGSIKLRFDGPNKQAANCFIISGASSSAQMQIYSTGLTDPIPAFAKLKATTAPTGQLIVEKTCSNGDTTTSFSFTVTNASGTAVATFSLTGGGSKTLTLDPGTYTISEASKSGWNAVSDQTATVTGGGSVTKTFTNSPSNGSLIIKKTCTNGDTSTSFTFVVTRNATGSQYSTFTLKGGGSKTISDLPAGDYTISETKKSGWNAVSDQTASVPAGGSVTKTFTNSPEEGYVYLHKWAIKENGTFDTSTTFTFTVKNASGTTVQTVTYKGVDPTAGDDSSKKITLAPGTYTITESKLAGWMSMDMEETLLPAEKLSQTFTVENGRSQDIMFINYASGKITLEKYVVPDSDGNQDKTTKFDFRVSYTQPAGIQAVTAAMASQIGLDIDPYGSYDLGSSSMAHGSVTMEVPVGTYKITEAQKDGWLCSQPVQTVTVSQNKTTNVIFENVPCGDITLYKKDADYGVPMAGTKFKLYKTESGKADSYICELVTDGTGKIFKDQLPVGRYKLVETETDSYHILDTTPVSMTVSLNQRHPQKDVSNKRKQASLTVTKLEEGSNVPLSGIEFEVIGLVEHGSDGYTLKDGGNAWEAFRASGVTDSNGKAEFSNLPASYLLPDGTFAPVNYYVQESLNSYYDSGNPVNLNGYKAETVSAQKWIPIEEGLQKSLTFTNKPVEGRITVKKVSEADSLLEGVTFELEYSVDNGRSWAPVSKRKASDPVSAGKCSSSALTGEGMLTTGADGIVVFDGLRVFTVDRKEILYRISEMQTLNGKTLLKDYVMQGPAYVTDDNLSKGGKQTLFVFKGKTGYKASGESVSRLYLTEDGGCSLSAGTVTNLKSTDPFKNGPEPARKYLAAYQSTVLYVKSGYEDYSYYFIAEDGGNSSGAVSDILYTVKNGETFMMPMTGDSGTVSLVLPLVFSGSAAAGFTLLGINMKRKRRKTE